MNQELNMRQNASNWLEKHTQTRREIIFPVPVSTALHQLKIAFASAITISNGFLMAKYKYTGEANDTGINVHFSVNTGHKLYYIMQGKLFPHPKGSHLVMTVKVKTPLLFFIAPLWLIFFALYKQEAAFAIFASLFFILSYLVMLWHLNSAANNVSSLIRKIIATSQSSFIIS